LGDGITIEVDDDTDYEPDAVGNCGPDSTPTRSPRQVPWSWSRFCHPRRNRSTAATNWPTFRVPSIQHYLIVRTKRREIIHHARSGTDIISRAINIGSVRMDPPGISIDVAEIYEGTS
jgi:hypothetical protein